METELGRHVRLRYHLVRREKDALVIHEPHRKVCELEELLHGLGFAESAIEETMKRSRFSPVMKFEHGEESYAAYRMTYRGNGGWSYPLELGPLDRLVKKLVPLLGTDELFELM